MTHKLHDVPIEVLMVKHYLFDLDESVEKTAEILSMDEDSVREIHDNYVKFIMPTRGSK